MLMNFQNMILTLQNYWSKQGCIMMQPYDVEKGAEEKLVLDRKLGTIQKAMSFLGVIAAACIATSLATADKSPLPSTTTNTPILPPMWM